jgi:hypothetical protein
MVMKEWIAAFICMTLVMGIWCIHVISMNKTHERKVLTTIHPLDLTVTYCESCKKCSIPEGLDALEFEDANVESI